MRKSTTKPRRKKAPKRVLALPDLEQSKAAVLGWRGLLLRRRVVTGNRPVEGRENDGQGRTIGCRLRPQHDSEHQHEQRAGRYRATRMERLTLQWRPSTLKRGHYSRDTRRAAIPSTCRLALHWGMSGTMARARAFLLIVAALGTIGCDRVTKHAAAAYLAGTPTRSFLGDTIRVGYVENTGGFLSLGAELGWNRKTGIVRPLEHPVRRIP